MGLEPRSSSSGFILFDIKKWEQSLISKSSIVRKTRIFILILSYFDCCYSMGCGKPNILHRVIDNSEDALVPIQIKRRTFERFRKHHNMFRPVDDNIV